MTKGIHYASFLLAGKILLRGGGSLAQLNIFGKNSLARGFLEKNFISVGRDIMTRDFFSALIFLVKFSWHDYFMTKGIYYASFLLAGKFLLRGGGSLAQLNIFGKNYLARGF